VKGKEKDRLMGGRGKQKEKIRLRTHNHKSCPRVGEKKKGVAIRKDRPSPKKGKRKKRLWPHKEKQRRGRLDDGKGWESKKSGV